MFFDWIENERLVKLLERFQNLNNKITILNGRIELWKQKKNVY